MPEGKAQRAGETLVGRIRNARIPQSRESSGNSLTYHYWRGAVGGFRMVCLSGWGNSRLWSKLLQGEIDQAPTLPDSFLTYRNPAPWRPEGLP
jgi:hypothetical protein